MISVQNHRQLLSGSKLFCFLIGLALLESCAPKILRSGKNTTNDKPASKETEQTQKENGAKEPAEEKAIAFNDIALVLPFQLDKVTNIPTKTDVDRSALALDFYQGFKMGLDRLAADGDNFRLNVLDSKDNTAEVQRLALSKEVQTARLVVGPIFPTEINVFSNAANLGAKLQISPLAASNPSQYKTNNLVTVTPPIEVHAKALAKFIDKQLSVTDQVVILNTDDEDSRKFLTPLKSNLTALKIPFKEINAVDELEAELATEGKNIVVTGAVNAYFISPLLVNLYRLKTENAYQITLIGHPNWIKLDLDAGYLAGLNTYITSSYYVDQMGPATRQFMSGYKSQYRVDPSEFAFKGYDAGIYFGKLLAKYPENYAKKLSDEKYKGLSMGFDFVNDPLAGYVNNQIMLLHFVGNGFKPL